MIKLKKFSLFYKLIFAMIILFIICFILQNAPYYKKNSSYGITNLLINNSNVTLSLKRPIIIQDEVIYLSLQDIKNYFDVDIYFDSTENRIITTSNTKIANLLLNSPVISINSTISSIRGSAFQSTDEYQTIYLPFSELKNVYNVDINYDKDSDIITVDSLSRKKIIAQLNKNAPVKLYARTISKTITKLNQFDSVVFISSNNKWSKIRTSSGTVGYVKTNYLENFETVREDYVENVQIDGKICLLWDYYANSVARPNNSETKIEAVNVLCPTLFELKSLGKGEIIDKAGINGKEYIAWAKNNGYKIWGLISNEGRIETTSEILNNFSLREKLIDNIIKLAVNYNLDGINVDFENMYETDKDMFSRFIIELFPRLAEKNLVLSVNVTAPDGSKNWSECYDRLVLGRNCDYVIFMAYDQYSSSSVKSGSTAGYNWVLLNTNKFLKSGGVNEVPSNKLILGIPLYSRVWTEDNSGNIIKNNNNSVPTIDLKDIYDFIPESSTITWRDDVKQNYAEWSSGNYIKKIWIEDEKSIYEKLSIIREKNLAGAAFWEKGRESFSIWEMVKENLI